MTLIQQIKEIKKEAKMYNDNSYASPWVKDKYNSVLASLIELQMLKAQLPQETKEDVKGKRKA